MLFSEVGIDDADNGSLAQSASKVVAVDSANRECSDNEGERIGKGEKAESVSSASSSDNYSFTNDTSNANGNGPAPKAGHKVPFHAGISPKKIPFAALPAAAAGEDSDGDVFSHAMRRNSSINSLSDPEIDIAHTRHLSSLVKPLRQHSDDSDSMLHISSKLPPSATLPPPLPITHARRAIGCLPSQNYDSLAESGSSSPSTKSHSRCASSSIVLSGSKKSLSNARSRRPSDGPDGNVESEPAALLIRSSSTDERLQSSNMGGSVTAMASSAGGSGSEAENASNASGDDDDDDADMREDEASERVFEEFSYKNLALLSHVNKGVSSSGHPMPSAERVALDTSGSSSASARPISASLDLSAQLGSGSSITPVKTRESLVNAYEINPKPHNKKSRRGNEHDPISQDDYFRLNAPFRLWLRKEKDRFFDEMPTEKARRYFGRFVQDWNTGRLRSKYYDPDCQLSGLSRNVVTRHSWGFAKQADREYMDDLKQEVRKSTFAFEPQVTQETMQDDRAKTKDKQGPTMPSQYVWSRESAQLFDEEQRERDYRSRKRERKLAKEREKLVLDEVAPKETGREAMLAKKRALNSLRNAPKSEDVEIPDEDLYHDPASDLAMLKRSREMREKKRIERKQQSSGPEDKREARLQERMEKERSTMEALRAMAQFSREQRLGMSSQKP
ncbi:hypothetical protein FB639_003962 [Coemansia asiatica]|nr:hypothetical protein FB639_003962 [Coemansia asiatica]